MLIAPLQDKNNLVHCLTVVMMMMRLINRMSQYDRYKDLDGQSTQNHLAGRFEIKTLRADELKVRIEADDRHFHPRASLMGGLNIFIHIYMCSLLFRLTLERSFTAIRGDSKFVLMFILRVLPHSF